MSGNKFVDPFTTAKGEARASVPFSGWKSLWFNTGTRCNLSCTHCYIESSPLNDRLSFITTEDVKPFLDEIKEKRYDIQRIGFTGGEPFLNPEIMDILSLVLNSGHTALVLTNACRTIRRHQDKLLKISRDFPGKLQLRISLDHYTQDVHERERGKNTFEETLESTKWLVENHFDVSVAGRSLTDETREDALAGYQKALSERAIDLEISGDKMVIFPEMDLLKDVPEITTHCWDILNKRPAEQMCASERMIVKRKGEPHCRVQACTLLAYQDEFSMGENLEDSMQTIQLNHPFCAQFCVLGGASCSSTK